MLSDKEIFKEVFNGPIGAQFLTDGSYVINEGNWFQLVSPNRLEASRNEVIISKLSQETVTEKIDQTISQYKDLGTSFKWIVGPETQPQNMADILTEKGFKSWFGRGMFAYTEDIKIPHDESVSVEKVSRDNLELYIDLAVDGWGWNTDLKPQFLQDYEWAIDQPDDKFNFYIAKHLGKPAGTSGFINKGRSAYLVGANVLKEFQGLGIYKQLIRARAEAAFQMGISLLTSGTREKTSAPILEKLGFKTAYRDQIFQYDVN